MWSLQWHNRRWSEAVAAAALYCPGMMYALFGFELVFNSYDPFGSWFFFWYHVTGIAIFFYVAFWFFTGIGLLIWVVDFLVPWRDGGKRSSRAIKRLLIFNALLLLLTSGATYYLQTYKTLEDAVRAGDVAMTERRLTFNLLGVGPNDGFVLALSSGPVGRMSLLPAAVKTNNIELVRLKLDHGANVNVSAHWDGATSPLALASRQCNEEIVRLLLDHGADPSEGLHAAAGTKWVSTANRTNPDSPECGLNIVALLLEYGGEPNQGLHPAASSNRLDVLQLLVAKGADVYIRDQSGKTILDVAVVRKATDVIQFLAQYELPLTDLHGFILTDQFDVFKQAIETGYDVNALYDTPYGQPNPDLLLNHAVRLRRAPFVEYLMQKGAEPLLFSSEARETAQTPLHVAVSYDAVEEARIMIRYGVDANIPNEDGLTPLYLAAAWGSREMVMVLLEAGANVNSVSRYNPRVTPLIETLDKPRQLEVERILLEHGADPNLGGYQKPLTYAVHHLNAEGARLLLEFGAELDGDPKEPVLLDKFNGMYRIKSPESVSRMLKTAEVLIDFGADPLAQVPGTGRSVIEEAEYRGNNELAQYLRSRLSQPNP